MIAATHAEGAGPGPRGPGKLRKKPENRSGTEDVRAEEDSALGDAADADVQGMMNIVLCTRFFLAS